MAKKKTKRAGGRAAKRSPGKAAGRPKKTAARRGGAKKVGKAVKASKRAKAPTVTKRSKAGQSSASRSARSELRSTPRKVVRATAGKGTTRSGDRTPDVQSAGGWKVGSSRRAAARVVGESDFGAHEQDRIERTYVSQETKRSDPGSAVVHSGMGMRTSGVGGNESGRGASSGGDMDADDTALIGIGDRNLNPERRQPQPSIPASQRPVLNPPAVDLRPARTGDLDNESSTSAADVTNETVDTRPGFEGDITADEATGQSHSEVTGSDRS